MTPDQAVQLVAHIGTSGTISGEWLHGHCPFAPWLHAGGVDNHPSFGLHLETGRFRCWSCDQKGADALSLLMQLKYFERVKPRGLVDLKAAMLLVEGYEEESISIKVEDWKDELVKEEKPQLHVFPDEWLHSFKPALAFPEAMEYLSKRGMTPEEIKKFELVYDTKYQRVCFPVRDWYGQLVGLHGRDITGKSDIPYLAYRYQKKINPSVWANEHNVNPLCLIVLCEGHFDMVSISRVYPNVLAALTSKVSQEKLKRIQDASSVITFYDAGAAGDKGRDQIERFFKREQCVVDHVIPPFESLDPGDMSMEEILEALTGRVWLGPDPWIDKEPVQA